MTTHTTKSSLEKIPHRQQGFALTELLIAVGIIAGIVAVISGVAAVVQSGTGASNEARNVETIAQNIVNLYGKAPNFLNLTQDVARDLQVFPDGMDDGNSVFNRWNGTVEVAVSADLRGNPNRAFRIIENDVPPDACPDLATIIAGAQQIQVNGTTVYQINDTTMDVAAIGTQCSTGPSEIAFLFEKR